jgi:hypothetical protein
MGGITMPQNDDIKQHIYNLESAFEKDGFAVSKVIVESGKVGIMAEHQTATNYDTGQKKKAYYLEGDHYQMGYLLGLLAEEEISRMAAEFSIYFIFAFIRKVADISIGRSKEIGELLVHIIYELSKSMYPEMPDEFKTEIQGIFDGCIKANPKTKVNLEHLTVLNIGVDILCSLVYTGDFLLKYIPGIHPSELKVPVACNGFSVFGAPAGGGHYFGRDFMYPTADVFQDVACLIVYNPDNQPGKTYYPFVNMTAPGMIGSVAAMNIHGVAVGVDMSPSGDCNPHRVGINSLLLSRDSIQFGKSADEAVEIMANAHRGVAWDYIIADGTNDKACIVEAGCSIDEPNFLEFPPDDLKEILPDAVFIKNHQSTEFRKGLMVRWNGYRYPEEYLKFNEKLWEHYRNEHHREIILYPDAFTEKGYINRKYTEENCPSVFYFAPLRNTNPNIVMVTNHFVVPEMRLCAMYPWTSIIVGNEIQDFQWRYDELNNRILTALETKGYIDYETAKELIDFLSPYGNFPDYYKHNPKSKDGEQTRIEGATSLFDLKNKTIESHYGYYCDEWVKITLLNYIEDTP